MSRMEVSLQINSAIPCPTPLCAIQIHVQTRYRKICRSIIGEFTTIEDYPTGEPFLFMFSLPTHLLYQPIGRNHDIASSLRLGLNLPHHICHYVAMKIGSHASLLGLQGFRMQAQLNIVNQDFIDQVPEWEIEEETMIIMDADDLESRKGVSKSVLEKLQKQSFDINGDELFDNDCVVCLNELNTKIALTQLPLCSHVFHQHCILRWLKRSKTCPICRGEVENSVV